MLIRGMSIRSSLHTFWRRAAQTARLMVGVGNYAAYVQHMQAHHPADIIMSREQHFRRCIDARDPKNGGKIHRCPC